MTSPVPPPPSSLAPPGPVAYHPETSQTRRIGGVAKAIVVLLAINAFGQIVSLATSVQARDAAERFLRTGDEDAFTDDLALNTIGSLIAAVAGLALLVLSLIWLYRVASNHRALGRQLTWTPGWAIGSWLVPPLLFVIPLLMLRESWKASSPDVPPGSAQWRASSDENPAIWAWFVLYSIVPIVLLIFGASQVAGVVGRDATDLADYIDDQFGVLIVQGVVAVFAAVAWGLVVRGLSTRHMQLSGEAGTR